MSWEKAAIKQQQIYYEVFGDCDWEGYKCSEIEVLERKIGFALYGLPEETPDDSRNHNLGYDKEKLESIQKISSCIKKCCESDTDSYSILVAFTFVILNNNDQIVPVPVFKVPKFIKGIGRAVYIDSDCRIYKDWNDYLNSNHLPACIYCYPNDGVYLGDPDDNVYVQIGKTPAAKTSKKVLKYLDHSATAVAVGGAVIGLASLTALPVAAPLLLASTVGNFASFLYGTGRSIETLVDRKAHKQDIGLKDSEARNCYLSMVGSALSVAAGAGVKVVSQITKSGEVIGKTGRVIVNTLNISSLVVNGAGIVNNLFLMKEHWESGNLTPLEVFQFSSSVLFFTHSLINVKTANTIIRETQSNVLTEFESSLKSNWKRKVFQLAKRTVPGKDTVTRNAKVIKAVNYIHNSDDYISSFLIPKEKHENSFKAMIQELQLDFGSLCQVMGKIDLCHCEIILNISLIIAEKLELKGACHILNIAKFICDYIQDIAIKMDAKYEKSLRDTKRKLGGLFDQNTFDRNYVTSEKFNHFVTSFLASSYKIPHLLEMLKDAYKCHMSSNNSTSCNIPARKSVSTSDNSLEDDKQSSKMGIKENDYRHKDCDEYVPNRAH